jgi:lipopolysaccharide export system ATP-binding protein
VVIALFRRRSVRSRKPLGRILGGNGGFDIFALFRRRTRPEWANAPARRTAGYAQHAAAPDEFAPKRRDWDESADGRFDYAGRTDGAPSMARRWDEPAEAPSGVGQRSRDEDDARHAGDSQDAEPHWDRRYLAVHGVEKSFAGRTVVKGVSLYLRPGEAVGLLGPNGAGKTTVFYMITGLVKADRGRIELDGHDITGLPMYQHGRLGIGYLPQEASIFRGLNVEQNIRAVLEQVEPDRDKREAEVDALLDEFNITHLRKTPSIALSGGERRRVEIARALASRPAYMLLDEPFAGIDPIAVGDIQALVRHLTQRGIGVLITDHNVRETLGLTDRAYIIYSGQVLMEGNTSDIVNDPEVRRLYLGQEFRL